MPNKPIRRSVSMTPKMADQLAQIAKSRPRNVTEADIIREALSQYLNNQAELIGSRRHFQRAFRDHLDEIEDRLAFQLKVIIYLLATDEQTLHDAIIAAKQHGGDLHKQLEYIRRWVEADHE